MSSTFSIKGRFEGDELVSGLKHVRDELSGTEKAAKGAGDELGEMLSQKNSTSNYRRQLMQLQKTIADLTINYQAMSKEMQNSALGKEMIEQIQTLTVKAAGFKEQMDDARDSIMFLSQGERGVLAMSEAMDALNGVSSLVTVAMGKNSKTAEEMVAVLTKLKSIEAVTSAVKKIRIALDDKHNVILRIQELQTKLLTKSIVTQTTATKGATIAQKILNAVANANPYVLLASAVAAVGTALFAFAKRSKEATEAEKAAQKAAEEHAESEKDVRAKEAKSVGEVVAKYRILQIEYGNLKTVGEKQDWIRDNASAFGELGLKVGDVNDADSIFITQSAQVIAALKARARAEALEEKYKEEVIKAEEAKLAIQHKSAEELNRIGTSNGDLPELLKKAGVSQNEVTYEWGGGQSGAGSYTLSPEAKAKIQAMWDAEEEAAKNAADSGLLYWEDKMTEAASDAERAAKEISSLLSDAKKPSTTPKSPANSSSSTQEEDIYDPESLRAAQKEVARLQDELSRLSVNDAMFESVKKQLEDAEKVVDDIRKKMSGESIDDETSLVKTYEDAGRKIADIQKKFTIGVIDEAEARGRIDEINAALKKLGLKEIEVKLKVDEDETPEVKVEAKIEIPSFGEQVEEIGDVISGIGSSVGSINSVYEAFKNLTNELEDAENGWESFMAIFSAVMTTMENACGIIKTVTSLTEIFTGITEALTAAKEAHAIATTTETSANIAEAASEGTVAAASAASAAAKGVEAGANTAAAASGAASAMASIPYVGPILAVAAVAAVLGAIMAAVSKSKKFAGGGIVGGASKIGDFNLARVNSGEMILNSKQQENLWKMINDGNTNGVSGVGQVEFKIKGSELVGAINNYNKRKERV